MIRIRDIILPQTHDEHALRYHAAQCLKVQASDIASLKIFRRSLDARKKPELRWVYTVDVTLRSGESAVLRRCRSPKITREEPYRYRVPHAQSEKRPVIAGFGPAGMFAALVLAMAGLRPIVLERGEAAAERRKKVEAFWNGGTLDPESNVQFGEGGAGTFSDGKLTTRINDPLCARVLEKFAEFGAPEEILTKAKPHIGTDNLREVVKRLRSRIIELGGEIRFLSPVENIEVSAGKLRSVSVNGEKIPCGALVLAVGHSAHDTFDILLKNGIALQPKAFSVGARIEHLQSDIDAALYGKYAGHPALPPAEYALSFRENDRGVYTFCMCPGGFVVASASSRGKIVTNGMSNFSRSGKNANSAVLVSVSPDDFGNSPLSGIDFIKKLEQKAFALGGGSNRAPAMLTREFIGGGTAFSLGKVAPTYLPGVEPASLRELFPERISDFLALGITRFNQKIRGFSDSDSVLTAIESRTSSPVRIPRGENGCALGTDGLYPCGEGAGYAGGIMSAAVDGIKTAVKIMERFKA